ncbi:helix-turn-helix domain-containing protein [Paenibacillus cremeus]|uniref:Helix-turn-helix transcriptional regulator n=1 Tax=Paenibacillus cremeus TaxID=2163881 RepID=A0A559KGC1_9BACL|nr:AraC family transcriptional regulator [Paenibacillus cremeus]TVY11171.1 helix-turn-helix transcriptional regulator [Paenibacillus cremeus]
MNKIKLSAYVPLKNKLFLRILLYFLSLLLPILITGSFLYINFNNKVKDDFKHKIQASLQSSADFIDIYLQTAQRSSISFFYDKNIMTLLLPYNMYSITDKIKLPNIPSTISRISGDVGEIIDNLFVYVDDQKVYTKDGVEDFEYFLNGVYRFEQYDAAFWRSRIKQNTYMELLHPSKVFFNQSIEKNAIPFVFSKTVNGHQAELVMTISVGTISTVVQKNALFSSTHFLILDNNDHLIWSSIGGKDSSEAATPLFTKEQLNSGELTIQGNPYFVTHIVSGVYGWKYYSLTPMAEFTAQNTHLFTMFLTVCLLLIIAGCILSFIFTFNLYNPIKKIQDVVLNENMEAPSRLSPNRKRETELDRIGIGIHQIIEKNNSYKKKLDSMSLEYIDHMLLHVMMGSKPVSDQELNKILRHDLSFKKEYFICCTIHFTYKPDFYDEIQDVERLMIMNKMKKIIESLIGRYLPVYVLESKQNVYVCLANAADIEGMNDLKRALRGLIGAFQHDSRYCSIHIALGNIHFGLDGIHKSYADSLIALEAADRKRDFLIAENADPAEEKSSILNKSDQLVGTIVQYIQTHYHQDLYLEKIADHLGVSSKYISKVFKEKTGTNLTDYISVTRINKAKEILGGTNMNISDISERVGIYSRTTFIRLFKKYEGVTPNEFRKARRMQL